ncbi:MAG: enoyl-CoA hydratase/isomerase family protein [Gemmatimonadota bacterium]|jgi:methylglutaconyl-CoA hydratase
MIPPVLEVEQGEGGQGLLTLWLNRPEKRNALNAALVDSLSQALRAAEEMANVRVLLLRGRGDDFCAGADLEELEKVTRQGPEDSLADAKRLGDLLLQIRRHPRPVVACVHGRALAGGCGLATACDLILASDRAEFGYPEVHLGFVPAMVMAILRQKLTEGKAFEMVALGGRLSAEEALEIGLINRVFPDSTLDEDVTAFALELAGRPMEALRLTKSLLYEQADLSVAGGVHRGAEVNVEARQTEACRAGVKAFLSRRNRPGGDGES